MLCGLVTDEAGVPIKGATIFLLPKGSAGFRRTQAASGTATTSAEGQWDLGVQDLTEIWIGAVADGYERAYVDGDSQHQDLVRFRLKRCREIVVVVEGLAGPPPDGTRVTARPSGESYALPGQGSARRFYLSEKVDPSIGRVSLHPPFRGAVEIRAQRYGFFAEPERRVLVAHEPTVAFRMVPSCVLLLRVSDAATGQPFESAFAFSVLREGTVVQGGSTSLAGGEFRLADRLRPGSHTVVISSDGYLDSRHEGVMFRDPGGEVTVEATLERDPTLGRLRVRVPVLGELPKVIRVPGGEPQPAPAFFLLRRRTPEATAWDFTPRAKREDATTYVFENLASGEVDVLVGNLKSKQVAILRSVRVPRGETNVVTASLRKGRTIDPAAMLPKGSEFKVVSLRSKQGESLPVVAQGNDWMSLFGPGDTLDLTKRLGPYPRGPLEMVLVDVRGREKTLQFKAESK